MDYDAPFDEIVLVELPSVEEAERLWLRLLPARMAWLHGTRDTQIVAVVLRAEGDDLARLLRELEAWLVERGIPQAQFELDGRTYSLRPRPAVLAGSID